MLEQIRKQSQSALIVLLFGFIIFVFVFSFGAGSKGFQEGGCGRSGIAAIVNGETIPDLNFRFSFEQQLRQLMQQRQGGKAIRAEDRLQLRQEVIQKLVDQELLRQAAARIGLHVTDQERNDAIRQVRDFQDDQKHFDFQRYKMIIQRYYQTSPAIFEEIWREEMLASRMADVIQATARVTDEELLQSYLIRETKVDLEFVKVAASVFAAEISASDSEIDEFVKSGRAQLEKYYESHLEDYQKPKRVQVAHVFFQVRKEYDTAQVSDRKEQADLTLDDLKKGGDFSIQVKEYSEDEGTKETGGELPVMTRDEITARWGAPVAEAAFALAEGNLSPVVKGEKGFHVLKCLKVVPEDKRPLETVQREIGKQLLIEERANQKAKAEAERLLTAVKAGKKLSELVPPAPTASDDVPGTPPDKPPAKPSLHSGRTGLFARNSQYIPNLGFDEGLIEAGFRLTKEHPLPESALETKSAEAFKTFVAFSLAERTEADMKAFPDAKKTLRDQILLSRRYTQLASWLDHERALAKIEVNPTLLTEGDFRKKGLQQPVPMDDDY